MKFEDLDCEKCIYSRSDFCYRKNEACGLIGWGCGEGKWIIKRHNGSFDTLDWEGYWLEYDDPDKIRDPITKEWNVKCPPKWEGCEVLDWRSIE